MKVILTIALALAAAGGGYAYFGNILPCGSCEGDKAIAVTTVSDTAKTDDCCAAKVDCSELPCDPIACDPAGCEEMGAGEYAMVEAGVLASPADAKTECSAAAKAECSEAKMECTEAKMECTEKKACDSKPSLD